MRDALAEGVLEKDLIKAIYEADTNTMVGLISSIPHAIRWSQEHVPAIIHVAHGGQDRGSALADVLFGDVNPAGRLTMNWPKTLDQLSDLLDYDIRHGRTPIYTWKRSRSIHSVMDLATAPSVTTFSAPTRNRSLQTAWRPRAWMSPIE